ncbi:hypothetical protein PYW07_015576 [Mythimna separata]|uniref:Uncharacterized protein n=1 Tax=Mythimna separata TaxID=271217 RepID=A0AAD8DZZ4_MYTSE|nr:hypothetical protein PYW07_015576 [Mythimna separata]
MLRRGMLPNAKRDMLFPGFPTMRHLKYQHAAERHAAQRQERHAVPGLPHHEAPQVSKVPGSMLRRGMLPNAKRDMLFPGFPTMRHLKYQVSRVNKR